MHSVRSRAHTSLAIALGLSLASQSARAQEFCFTPPANNVPGLPGMPSWTGAAPIRTDLNEPRWGAAPLSGFKTDATNDKAFYRVMRSADGTKLYVQFQANFDHGGVTPSDRVFLGLAATSGNTAKAVTFSVNSASNPASNPTSPSGGFTEFGYASAAWTVVGPSKPTWVDPVGVWTSNTADPVAPDTPNIDWGVAMVVDVVGAGLVVGSDFRILVGMAITNADGTTTTNLYTPATVGSPTNPFTGAAAPSTWQLSASTTSACLGGVELGWGDINVNGGTQINVTDGAVNTFNATPAYNGAPVIAGSLNAEFRIAYWGSNGDPTAPWMPIVPASGPMQRPSDASGNFSLACAPSAGGLPCGITTPVPSGHLHQCVQTRLNYALGYDASDIRITTPSVYQNMNFVALSKSEKLALIDTKGIDAGTPNNDLYFYVYPRNLPAHGNEQLYLPTDRMRETLRRLETSEGPVSYAASKREAAVLLARAKEAQLAAAKSQPPAGDKEAAQNAPSVVTEDQALRAVWPHYEVRPYYDSGKRDTLDGVEAKKLVPMYPFTAFYSHEGPLFGFSHAISLVEGGTWTELEAPTATKPGLYKLTLPKDGKATLKLTVEAHERRKDDQPGGPGGTECPKCQKVDHGHCNCSLPGYGGGTTASGIGLGGVLLAIWFALRRRRGTR